MPITELIKQAIPPRFQPGVRKVWHWTRERTEEILGLREPLTPPGRLNYVGNGSFKDVGQHLLELLRDKGGLKPCARILDIGSGNGRVAVPLATYLDERGSYEGIEIVQGGVEWCQRQITPRFPRLRFQRIDVFNSNYNPGGKIQAKDYRFPFSDGEFDFVILTSVFTHMLPEEVSHYLGEIARVLKPRGRCLATFFLLNPESQALLDAKKSSIYFPHQRDGYAVRNEKVLEDAVAFPEDRVRTMIGRSGLAVHDSILYGTWCGRPSGASYQDVVIADKPWNLPPTA